MIFFNYKSKYKIEQKLKIIILSIIFYSFIYSLFNDYHFSDKDIFSKHHMGHISSRIYMSIIIQSSVGLDNIFPTTNTMRYIIASQALSTLIIAIM